MTQLDEALVAPASEPPPDEALNNDEADLRLVPYPASDVRRTYLDATIMGYLSYALGAVVAFLALALALSDSEAALHSSAFAAGMIAAGFIADRLDRAAGTRRIHFVALAMLMGAIVVLVSAVAFAFTLAAAATAGLGLGIVLTHANQVVTAGGGSLARVRMARAALISTVVALAVPVAIGVGESTGIGWWVVALPLLALLAASFALTRTRTQRPVAASAEGEASVRLPRAYWTAWLMAALAVGIEFVIVVWAGTLVAKQSEVSLATATLVISALSAGVIVGRVGLSFRSVSERDPIWLLRGGIAIALVGVSLAWLSTSFEISMLVFFLAGLGLSSLFPIAAVLTMSAAPLQASLASGRLVLAQGIAILIAPFLLGVIADSTGVVTAWLLIPALCIAALLLSVQVARQRTVDPAAASAT